MLIASKIQYTLLTRNFEEVDGSQKRLNVVTLFGLLLQSVLAAQDQLMKNAATLG